MLHFNTQGVLPPYVGADPTTSARSPYIITTNDLVINFGTTPKRNALIQNLITYRMRLYDAGFVDGVQYIDGSFVENVESTQLRAPNDIDIFSFLRAPERYQLNPQAWASEGLAHWNDVVVNREKNKQELSLDTYAILVDELSWWDLLDINNYWSGLFSHQRGSLQWKGFLAIPLDPTQDVHALTTLGSPI